MDEAAWVRLPRFLRLPRIRSRWSNSVRDWRDGTSVHGRVRLSSSSAALLAAAALPMEPKALGKGRNQWFEGWFLRLVDHETDSSAAVIFGSMRRRANGTAMAATPFDEHILVVAHRNATGAEVTRSLLLEGHAVTLRGGGTGEDAPYISWWSDQHGGMQIDRTGVMLELYLPGSLRMHANISRVRVPWNPRRPNHDGPEGWLAPTGLLPCHYFVHSFGSPATYTWTAGGGEPASRSTALVHIERNYGEAFPTGWVWAQAAAAGGAAYLILTGGLFAIGPLTVKTYILGLRLPRPMVAEDTCREALERIDAEDTGDHSDADDVLASDGLQWDFRTTDLDTVHDVRRPCEGSLLVNATSRNGRRRLEVRIAAPPHTFGAPIMVPTNDGRFSDRPGCRESYAAVAHITAWSRPAQSLGQRRKNGEWRVLVKVRIPLAALEFGGIWQFPC